jgi:hypothetical protein
MTAQQPSVGRIVHYVSHGSPVRADGTQAFTSECRAAIITGVHDMDPAPAHGVPYVDLFVMNPTGVFLNQGCKYDEGGVYTAGIPRSYAGGTWHWPERV